MNNVGQKPSDPQIVLEKFKEADVSQLDTINQIIKEIGKTIITRALNKDEKDDLGIISTKFTLKIKEIKAQTSGILGFFRYLFYPALKAKKQTQVQIMEILKNFIDNLKDGRVREASSPAVNQEELLKQEKEDLVLRINQLNKQIAEQAEKISHYEKGSANVSQAPIKQDNNISQQPSVSDFVPPPPPVSNSSVPPPPPMNNTNDSPFVPPPPPMNNTNDSSFAPPPPPPMNNTEVKPKLTAEQKYYKREQEKLEKALEARANPDNFYVVTPPGNATQLEKEKQVLEKFIEDLKAIKNKENAQKAESLIKDYQLKIEQKEEELKGTRKPLDAKDKTKQDFLSKIDKFTNEELKILIGIGKGENQQLQTNQKIILDEILKEWNQLSTSPTGKIFLQKEMMWKALNNVNSIFFHCLVMFEETKKGKRIAREYKIAPYDPNKKSSIPNELNQPKATDNKSNHQDQLNAKIKGRQSPNKFVDPLENKKPATNSTNQLFGNVLNNKKKKNK